MDKWRRKSLREREISELTTCNMRYMTVDVEKTTLTRKKCFIPRSTGILYLLCSASTISIHSGNFSASPVSQHLLLLFFSKTKNETGKRVFPLEIFRSHGNKKWLRLTNKVIITLSGKISVYYTFMMTMILLNELIILSTRKNDWELKSYCKNGLIY